MNFARRFVLSTSVAFLVALPSCSGGGSTSSDAGPAGLTFVTWNGTVSGSTVFDDNNDRFAVRADTRQVFDLKREATIGNWTVTGASGSGNGFYLFQDGVVIGSVYSLVTNSGTYSVFGSADGYFLDISFDGAMYRWVETSRAINSGGGGGGSSGGGGGSGGGGSSGGGGISFINWANSANGTVVKDASNDNIRFRADTYQMYISPYTITNCYVDSSAQLYWNGVDIGSVALVNGTGGYQIAALVNNSGHLIDIFENGGQYYWQNTSLQGAMLEPDSLEVADLPKFAQETGVEVVPVGTVDSTAVGASFAELFALEAWELQGLFPADAEELAAIEAIAVFAAPDCRRLASSPQR